MTYIAPRLYPTDRYLRETGAPWVSDCVPMSAMTCNMDGQYIWAVGCGCGRCGDDGHDPVHWYGTNAAGRGLWRYHRRENGFDAEQLLDAEVFVLSGVSASTRRRRAAFATALK